MVITVLFSFAYACQDDDDKPTAYTITFSVDDTEYATLETSGNQTLTFPATPSKNGYVFQGWYEDKALTLPFTENSLAEKSLKENITVYGKWDFKSYVATFKAEGVTIGEKTFIITDTALTDVPQVPEKNGYKGEWGNYELNNDDIIVNAVYTPIDYSITYIGTKMQLILTLRVII